MSAGPLAGVRVIEIAGIGPGPFCGLLLADLGADVVRVDRPGGGRTLVPWEGDPVNRNKRSVVIDVKADGGADAVLSLVEHADILFEGFRPGVAERLGIGPEQCWERRPSLVYGRMTGWGQSGPLSQSAGHDLSYLAPTGVLHALGPKGGAPAVPLNLIGDLGGGAMYLALGLLAALHESQRSGQGQVVDAAIVDGAAHLMTMLYGFLHHGVWRDERGSNIIDGGAPYYSTYETADGEYLAIAPMEPEFWAAFVQRSGLAEQDAQLRADPARWGDLRDRIADLLRMKTQAEWVDVFGDSDACVAPVLPMTGAPTHPHLAERDTFVTADGISQPAPAPRFSRTPTSVRLSPPMVGTTALDDVLRDWTTST